MFYMQKLHLLGFPFACLLFSTASHWYEIVFKTLVQLLNCFKKTGSEPDIYEIQHSVNCLKMNNRKQTQENSLLLNLWFIAYGKYVLTQMQHFSLVCV